MAAFFAHAVSHLLHDDALGWRLTLRRNLPNRYRLNKMCDDYDRLVV